MQHSPFSLLPPKKKEEVSDNTGSFDDFLSDPPSPGDITIQEITSTSIRVSWDRAADDLTTVTGYVLSYVDASGLETETVFSKPCDPNEYTLTGLNPDSYYKIIVKTQLMEAGVFPEQEGDDDSSVQFNTGKYDRTLKQKLQSNLLQ